MWRAGRGTLLGAALALSLGCSGKSVVHAKHRTPSGTAGEGGATAAPPAMDAGPDARADAIPLDTADCASRPAGNCTAVGTEYESNVAFDATPALAQCSMFGSYDGCGVLVFAFDAQGCASSVSPGPAGWPGSEHLELLRECLTDAFAAARFACVASQSLRYDESCYVF